MWVIKVQLNTNYARRLKREEMEDLIYKTWKENPKDSKAMIELNAVDPSDSDGEGVYLEIVLLDDYSVAVRDRWQNYDADYTLVKNKDVFDIFVLLCNQVDAQKE